MKKILIPLLALILLLSCGAGAYFYMGSQSQAATGEEPIAHEQVSEGSGGDFEYVEVPPIILPIIGREGISQTVSLVISLEVKGEEVKKEVKSNLPRLADAYLSDMYGSLSQQGSMRHGVINVLALKERLVAVTKKVMGDAHVENVLLQVLQQYRS